MIATNMVSFVRLFAETVPGEYVAAWYTYELVPTSREDDRFGAIGKVLAFLWNGSVGTSESERSHLHEGQAQDAFHKPVVEKTATSLEMHAYIQLIRQPPTSTGAIFHHDNARSHTTRVSQEWIRTITTLPSPARSPDMSPIEHIWDHLR
ncbi:hypothetical protein TNCV_3379801 [Trichonephila clavipes]|nr:hypothetical protein TNCV_3379801 [Trichonephila clavipes]